LVVFLLDLSQGVGEEEEVIAAKLIEFERPYLDGQKQSRSHKQSRTQRQARSRQPSD
jgi:hypothetical protein